MTGETGRGGRWPPGRRAYRRAFRSAASAQSRGRGVSPDSATALRFPAEKLLRYYEQVPPPASAAGGTSDPELSFYQGCGAGGTTTGGRSSHVIVFGSSHDASHGPVVPPPSLPPRSVRENSEPAGVKWNEPQLFTPTAPTLRASTFSKVAEPADRALTTDVPVPSTLTSLKCTLLIE